VAGVAQSLTYYSFHNQRFFFRSVHRLYASLFVRKKEHQKSNLRSITLGIMNITLNKRPYFGDLNNLVFMLFGLKLVEK
jgi:hypothetical protein